MRFLKTLNPELLQNLLQDFCPVSFRTSFYPSGNLQRDLFPFLLALLKPKLEVFIFKTQIQKHRSVVTTLI